MCIGCWQEAGSPQIDTPAVREAARLTAVVYTFNGAAGNLHCELDDWNLDPPFFKTPAEEWPNTYPDRTVYDADVPGKLEAERACYAALQKLTEEQRISAVALCKGYWKAEGFDPEDPT